MPRTASPLRKGMTLREVEAVLGDNGYDERGDGTYFIFEFLVWDEVEMLRLASADVWFRGGKLTRWDYEVELIADTWKKIKAGDPPTLWAAGRMGEPSKEVTSAMIEMLAQRNHVERQARAKAEREAARKAGVPVAEWRARRRKR